MLEKIERFNRRLEYSLARTFRLKVWQLQVLELLLLLVAGVVLYVQP